MIVKMAVYRRLWAVFSGLLNRRRRATTIVEVAIHVFVRRCDSHGKAGQHSGGRNIVRGWGEVFPPARG